MAQRHSVDDYLETIWFLAFPIGEYRPVATETPTLASRVAEMLGVSRASAGEMLKRLEADGLDRTVDDVVQQEEEDAGRGRGERGLQREVRRLKTAERKADEDRRSGNGSEDQDLGGRQVRRSFGLL